MDGQLLGEFSAVAPVSFLIPEGPGTVELYAVYPGREEQLIGYYQKEAR